MLKLIEIHNRWRLWSRFSIDAHHHRLDAGPKSSRNWGRALQLGHHVMESPLPPTDESTRVGRFVQWTERHERPNGRIDAPLQSRRIIPGSHEFKPQRLGDGNFLGEFHKYWPSKFDFSPFIRRGSSKFWVSRNSKIGKIIFTSTGDSLGNLLSGFWVI